MQVKTVNHLFYLELRLSQKVKTVTFRQTQSDSFTLF